MLISQPLAMPMPSLPARPGQSRDFARDLTRGLVEFAGRWHTIVPLETPLGVTVLVVPPEQGKDLDNIALAVLPRLVGVLRPGLPAREAITSYQVVELTRRATDPKDGYLRVVLGAGAPFNSDWDLIADHVQQHLSPFGEPG